MAKECSICGDKAGSHNAGFTMFRMCDACALEILRAQEKEKGSLDQISLLTLLQQKAKTSEQKKVFSEISVEISGVPIQNFDALARENMQQKYNTLKEKSLDGYWEYNVISLVDENGFLNTETGKVNLKKMSAKLNEMGLDGWRLVTAYSNELGKNAFGSSRVGINSTIDEHILIFERFVRIKPD